MGGEERKEENYAYTKKYTFRFLRHSQCHVDAVGYRAIRLLFDSVISGIYKLSLKHNNVPPESLNNPFSLPLIMTLPPTLAAWVNPAYLHQPEHLCRQFLTAKPFPHLVLRDFFLPQKAEEVLRALTKEQWTPKHADLFSFQQTHDLQSSRNPIMQEYYHFFSSKAFRDLIASITNTHPLRSIDAAGQIYSSGDYLLPHDDRLEGRKIAYVLNLTKGFAARDGGQLDFFAVNPKTGHPTAIVRSFTPRFNTLILFKVSPRSFHQVREVITDKQRISIGGWFHG